MKIVVSGGRKYGEWPEQEPITQQEESEYKRLIAENTRVFTTLNMLHSINPITLVGVGDCPTGVDRLVKVWAEADRVPFREFKAEWDKYGRTAGPLRNTLMLQETWPDLVVAFPGGKGTLNTVRRAKALGFSVFQVEEYLP